MDCENYLIVSLTLTHGNVTEQRTGLTKFHEKIQLSLEQHGFELCEPTYMKIFSANTINGFFSSLQLS